MALVIETSGLIKRFGSTIALDGLDLQVAQGEVHGFLGPNGAGKSTTLRVLLGLLRADGGRARMLGGDPWRDITALHRRVAYIPGDVNLWPNLTGGEVIDMLGRMRGGFDPARRKELLERFDVAAMEPAGFWGVHFMSEAGRLAFADRSVYMADPAFYTPPAGLLDPAYLAARSALIRSDASLRRAQPGDPPARAARRQSKPPAHSQRPSPDRGRRRRRTRPW